MIYNEREMRLLRIGIFYDGNYFYHVSNYYCYGHSYVIRCFDVKNKL